MAFLLYQKTKRNSSNHYELLDNVVLAGRRNGLIYSACKNHLRGRDIGWTISARDMLKAAEHDANHAVVIDTKPSSPRLLNLFEIESISGYSYPNWTPLMLTLEELFADKPGSVREIAKLKQNFSDAKCTRRIVRAFLYLAGGYGRGGWTWGGNNRTTAALLWPEAWRYFLRQTR